MSALDLSTRERQTIRIILPSRKKSFFKKRGTLTLDVYTPTKSTREMFTFLGESLIKISKNEATEKDIDLLYDVTARILSRNKQYREIFKNDLEDLLEIPEVVSILKAYADFLTETIESKN